MAATEPTKLGEIDGWTITEDPPGVLTATKPGCRPCRVGGEPGADRGRLRLRLMEAMAETDGAAGNAGGQGAATAGATGHPAAIVVHDGQG